MALPLLAGAVGAGLIGGIGNYLSNKDANERAQMIQDRQFQEWLQLNVPDPAQQRIALEQYVSTGKLSPKLQEAIAQSPSEFQNVVVSQSQKSAQNRALQELENIGDLGGLRLQDKAALQESMLQSQVQDRAARQGIQAEMARRGLSNSGFDLAARLSGQQAVGDRNARNSLQVAAQAQDRALQAIMGAGNLATQYRTQDVGEQQAKASAADRINQFNTANLRDVNAANVASQNAAQQYNLGNKQRLSERNTDLSNQQQMYNKQLLQQQYDNQVKRLGGATGQANQLAATEQRGGQIAGDFWSNLGGGVAGGLSSAQAQNSWDEYLKKKK